MRIYDVRKLQTGMKFARTTKEKTQVFADFLTANRMKYKWTDNKSINILVGEYEKAKMKALSIKWIEALEPSLRRKKSNKGSKRAFAELKA